MLERCLNSILTALLVLLATGLPSFAETIAPGIQTVRPYPTREDVCQVVKGSGVQDHAKGTVIACPDRERGAIRDRKHEGAEILLKAKGWTLLKLAQTPDLQDITDHYMGRTIVYFDRSHGTQVEYYDQSGAYLWYPGNTVILPGAWKVSAEADRGGQICFRYPTSSLNPVTGVKGSDWECSSLRDQQSSIKHRLLGDPFALKSGKVPFIFKRHKRMSLSALTSGAGLEPGNLVQIIH